MKSEVRQAIEDALKDYEPENPYAGLSMEKLIPKGEWEERFGVMVDRYIRQACQGKEQRIQEEARTKMLSHLDKAHSAVPEEKKFLALCHLYWMIFGTGSLIGWNRFLQHHKDASLDEIEQRFLREWSR